MFQPKQVSFIVLFHATTCFVTNPKGKHVERRLLLSRGFFFERAVRKFFCSKGNREISTRPVFYVAGGMFPPIERLGGKGARRVWRQTRTAMEMIICPQEWYAPLCSCLRGFI